MFLIRQLFFVVKQQCPPSPSRVEKMERSATVTICRWPVSRSATQGALHHEPFRMASNLHCVGATGVSAFLITTREDDILLAWL